MDICQKTRLGRTIVTMFFLAACSLFFSGCGESRTYKIGILSGLDYCTPIIEGFKAKLTGLGYTEGKNIVYDVKNSNFNTDEYRSAIKQFLACKVDLIFVFPTEATMEVKQATKGTNIPIVFSIANIEGTGLIQNIRKPGGNITGVRYPGPDIVVKRFEVMRELAPQAKRYWLPYQKGYPIVNSQFEALRPVAKAAGITLIEAPATNATELETALQAQMKAGGIDAILFLSEPLCVTPEDYVVMAKFATEHKIPIGGAIMDVGGYGTIYGINVDFFKTGEQAAAIADKIFKGAKAGLIPVVSSENYFEINYKIAQKFGVNVSESLLNQADKIIR